MIRNFNGSATYVSTRTTTSRARQFSVTVRDEPKVNRRRELKKRNAALRKWKRRCGVNGRMDAGIYEMFVTLWHKGKSMSAGIL